MASPPTTAHSDERPLDLERRYPALGRRLREIRRNLEATLGEPISQEEMVDRLYTLDPDGVRASQPSVSRWESGKERPNEATLLAYARLAGEDPRRLLHLGGYGFAEDDLPEVSQPRSPSAGLRRTWWRLLGVSAGLAVVALLIAYALRDDAPSRAAIRDGRLDVFAGDRVLWSRQLGEDVQQVVEPLVVDLDGDGRKEVVVGIDTVFPPRWGGRLVAFSGTGARLWTFHYGRPLKIGERSFTPHFASHHLVWLDQGPTPYVLVVSHHVHWFPTQVVLLEPATGKVVAEYWHPGYLEGLEVFDVGADGTPELLLSGVNNPGDGPGRAALVVLDLPFAPASEPDAVFGFVHARERQYLLFPRVDLQDATSTMAIALGVTAETKDQIVVQVATPDRHDLLLYSLNADLVVTDLRVADSFVRMHDRVLDHRYDPSELEAWERVDRFRRAPDANRLGEGAGAGVGPGIVEDAEGSP